MLAVQTWKWLVILERQKIRVSFKKLYLIQLVSAFYGTITPGRVGSFLKISYLADLTDYPAGRCSISVVIDKILDIIVLISFAAVGCIVSLRYFGIGMLVVIIILATAFVLSLFLLTENSWRNKLFATAIVPAIPERFKPRLQKFACSFYGSTLSPRNLIFPLSLTFLSWLISYSQIYLVAVALSIKVSYIPFIFLIAVGALVGLLPLSISGLGTREAALIIVLTPWGLSAQEVMAISLLGILICSYIPALAGGGLAVLSRKKYTRD